MTKSRSFVALLVSLIAAAALLVVLPAPTGAKKPPCPPGKCVTTTTRPTTTTTQPTTTTTVPTTTTTAPTTTTTPPTAGSLPRQGISTGYKILNRTTTDRRLELDQIKRVFNGHPGFVRVDSTSGNQAQVDAFVTDVLARGMTPMLILYGSTGPHAVDSFGHDQAVKWAGRVSFFEIANEPDLNGWTPDGYADFAKGVAASVKSGNPSATVIAGAFWKGTDAAPRTTQDYCRSLAVRAKGSFDMLSLHLYDDATDRAAWNIWDRAFPSLFGRDSVYKGNTCRELLNANGMAAVPIISTESGGPVNTYGEAGQASIVGHDFDALDTGLIPAMAVYSMRDDDVTGGWGLLRADLSERPAYATFMSRAES